MSATPCPHCDTPNSPDAMRCACGYQLRYPDEIPGQGGGGFGIGIAGALALAGAVAVGVAWWVQGAIRDGRSPPEPAIGLLLIAMGLFCVAGGALDWSWFMTNRRARLFVAIFGRGGARAFYMLLGGAITGAGAALFLA